MRIKLLRYFDRETYLYILTFEKMFQSSALILNEVKYSVLELSFCVEFNFRNSL